MARSGWWQRPVVAEGKLGEVIHDIGVGPVLFINFQDAAVFGVVGRKDPGRFAGQEDTGVGPAAVGEAANNDHVSKGAWERTKVQSGRMPCPVRAPVDFPRSQTGGAAGNFAAPF